MTLIDHGPTADTPTKKHRTGLIAVLAVLAVALLAAGAWLIVDRQQQPLTTEQQHAALMDVVTAHRDALEAADRDAILATLTDDATALSLYGYSATGNQLVYSRDDYADYFASVWGHVSPTFLEDPVFLGELPQVTIRTRLEYPPFGDPAEPRVGNYYFTLREVDGQWKIATVVFAESYRVRQGAATG